MPSAQKGKCIYRVREIESPIHKVFRGLRIEVTTPNMAGRKPWSDVPIPSFDKPYRVCQFGDYEDWNYLQRVWPKICAAIYRMGFTEIVQYKPEDFRDGSGEVPPNKGGSSEIPGIDTEEEA